MKVIRAAKVSKTNWKQEMYQFLRQYRSTPHVSTGFTPYRLMFQREPKTKMPQVFEQTAEKKIEERVRQNDEKAKFQANQYGDSRNNAKESNIKIGDTVLVEKDSKENKLSARFNGTPHLVTEKKGSMITASSNVRDVTRNSTSFKKITPRDYIQISEEEEEDEPEPCTGVIKETANKGSDNSAPPTVNSRPVRVRHEPIRFKDYVKY